MDIQAIMADIEKDPLFKENGEFYRELLDNSESETTSTLKEFVEKLLAQNGGNNEGKNEKIEVTGDSRRTLDRSTDIEYYTNEQLGPNREKTPEGFLICYDVPVARIGEMIYGPGETPIEAGRDGKVTIHRREGEVFSPRSLASLNGKPVTDDHPPVDVEPRNWQQFTRGVVVNPRRGEDEYKNFLVADLIVYDPDTIADIEAGKREVSCGYTPDYIAMLDSAGNEVPGVGEQANILYNHLALVSRGRCGPRCSIGDRRTVDSMGKEHKPMSIRSLLRDARNAFRAKDEAAFDDAMEELKEQVDDRRGGGRDEEEEPETVEIHNHIPGQDTARGELPVKDPVEGNLTADDEPPPWFEKFSKDCMSSMDKMRDDIGALQKWAKEEGQEPEHQEDNESGEPPDDLREGHAGSSPESANLEMDRRNRDRRGRDNRDEANKGILGELEFEAPPGTGDKARKAKDSAYLEDAFQDTVSKAETLAPGIRLPTFDKAANPVKTFKAISGLRRTALDLAYSKPETRGVIDSVMSGRTMDSKSMSDSVTRAVFNAAAGVVALSNNSRTADRGAISVVTGTASLGGRVQSLADMNIRNREKYGRKAS